MLFTGKTVEEAIQAGLASLGLGRSEVTITVVAKEKAGFLGFGRKEAQVELTPLNSQSQSEIAETNQSVSKLEKTGKDSEPEVQSLSVQDDSVFPSSLSAQVKLEPETDSAPAKSEELSSLVAADNKNPKRTLPAVTAVPKTDAVAEPPVMPASDRPSQREQIEEAGKAVLAYLEKIIYEMDLEADLSVQTSRRQIVVQIETPEPGRMIGYHGKILKAIQLLGQSYINSYHSRNFSLVLNVNDYLEHRTETLVDVANKMGQRVLATGRPYRMEPMNNLERKTVHKAIAQIDGLESYSEGEDPNRYVVIVSRDCY